MSIELKQAAQAVAEAIDWLLKNIRLNAPHLSGKAMGNAEKCASALRTAIQQAESEPVAHKPSQPHGMNLGERIKHVGGRENAQGYIEFGSVMAVRALINQVIRDTHPAPGVSDGWQLVPIEPTAEMLQAALKVATPGALRAAWARMLAASPVQKGDE